MALGVPDIRRKINDDLIRYGVNIIDRQEIAARFNMGGLEYGYLSFMRTAHDANCHACKSGLTCVEGVEAAKFCPFCGAEIGAFGGLRRRREEVLDALLYTIFALYNGELVEDERTKADIVSLVSILRRDHERTEWDDAP